MGRGGYRYKYGLNMPEGDINISPDETCCAGGLYFTYIRKGDIHNRWVDRYAYQVSVPDNARVCFYDSENKFKTSALLIEREWTEEYREYIHLCGRWLQHIEKQTPELCLSAVKKNGIALRYVKEQTPEICLAAVKQEGIALLYIKEQTPEICLAAAQKNDYVFQYIKEQTREICLELLQKDGCLLKYVRKQTPELCMVAVRQNSQALQYVKEPTLEICIAAGYKEG